MDWQQIAALACVAAAFLYLLRTQVFPSRKKPGCGACGGCASASPSTPRLLSADDLPVLPRRESRHSYPQMTQMGADGEGMVDG